MAKRNLRKKRAKTKIHQKRKKNQLSGKELFLFLLFFALLGTGFYFKEKIAFYYAMYFNKFEHNKLKNTVAESKRIDRILGDYADKTFGFDISHYQEIKDIKWDSLSIGNRSIPLKFVVMRASMGTRSKDRNFNEFWKLAKKHRLIRGAYHFYRADEDPIKQANNFLESVKLEEDDLVPILDIEKNPYRYSKQELIENLKIWCKLVEEKYGKKPIIYTYYYFYQDYLKGEFDDYPLWLANYNDVAEASTECKWDFWQFTENGIVYGIDTKVDLDIYNASIWSLKSLTLD